MQLAAPRKLAFFVLKPRLITSELGRRMSSTSETAQPPCGADFPGQEVSLPDRTAREGEESRRETDLYHKMVGQKKLAAVPSMSLNFIVNCWKRWLIWPGAAHYE